MDSIICKKCKSALIEYYLKEISLIYNNKIYSILSPIEYFRNKNPLLVCIPSSLSKKFLDKDRDEKKCQKINKYIVDCKIRVNKSIREYHAIKIIQAWWRVKLYDYETLFSREFIAFKLGPEGRKGWKDFN